jgi:hypothetical protein
MRDNHEQELLELEEMLLARLPGTMPVVSSEATFERIG